MKKILFYFNSLQPSGGIERVISTLANNFVSDFSVTILVKDEPKSFYNLDDRIQILSLENPMQLNMNSRLNRIFSVFKSLIADVGLLSKKLKDTEYDYYYLAHPLNALEFHLAKGIGVRTTVVTEHGAPVAYNAIYRGLKKWLYKKAKSYVVPTTSDTDFYRKMDLPAVYIPHFRSKLPYKAAPLKARRALSVGRFTDDKRQWLLIDIWSILVNKFEVTNWQLDIVGSGELRSILEERIKIHHLENYVFLRPPIQHVEEYYQNASLFLLTSSSEGFGMVLLEAISFGLPCVSFDCPSGPRDIIVNEINGYLVKNGDINEFADKVMNLIANESLIQNYGSSSFELSQNWTDDKVKRKWMEILN